MNLRGRRNILHSQKRWDVLPQWIALNISSLRIVLNISASQFAGLDICKEDFHWQFLRQKYKSCPNLWLTICLMLILQFSMNALFLVGLLLRKMFQKKVVIFHAFCHLGGWGSGVPLGTLSLVYQSNILIKICCRKLLLCSCVMCGGQPTGDGAGGNGRRVG